MPAYIETLDPGTPAGSADASLIDDFIRQGKRAFIERLGTDHEFQSDETGNNNIGYHKKVTLTKRSTDPDPVVDAGIFYSKANASGEVEAFFIDEAGNICQLTNRGQLARPGKFVEMWFGTIALMPAGYYLCEGQNGRPDLRDKFIVGARQDDQGVPKTLVEGTLASSGSPVHNHSGLTGSTILTVAQVPALTITIPGYTPNAGGASNNAQMGAGSADNSITSATTNAGGLGHDHTISAVSAIPPYYALAFITQYNA